MLMIVMIMILMFVDDDDYLDLDCNNDFCISAQTSVMWEFRV